VLFTAEYRGKTKIFCIGNITVGGAGKTQFAIEIGKILKSKGINFAYLSKGYKGHIEEFTRVEGAHTSQEVGDEPLLLAEISDTFVCRNRKMAIKILNEKYNYDLIIMDDGFQNPTIYKDKNIVIVDGEYGIGNGELLPSGPLRETVGSAYKRATFFVIVGQDKQNICDSLYNNNIAVVRAFIQAKNKPKKDSQYVAFCGIGRANKFFNSLNDANYKICHKCSFEDHHAYTSIELHNIVTDAEKHNASIITTKKDWVRLPREYKEKIDFLDIELTFVNREEFLDFLLK
jgi:tetraacyldisaccharide 4'-kinase